MDRVDESTMGNNENDNGAEEAFFDMLTKSLKTVIVLMCDKYKIHGIIFLLSCFRDVTLTKERSVLRMVIII
jgi:hypothetical protein